MSLELPDEAWERLAALSPEHLASLSGPAEPVRRAGVSLAPEWSHPEVGQVCPCGDPDCWHYGNGYDGYPFCLRCREHHRYWPDCPGIDAEEQR